jgi:hypothetical protein
VLCVLEVTICQTPKNYLSLSVASAASASITRTARAHHIQGTRSPIAKSAKKSTGERMAKRIKCEVYSRVVGFLRPVENWNAGKKAEWQDRKTYRIDKTLPVGERHITNGEVSR